MTVAITVVRSYRPFPSLDGENPSISLQRWSAQTKASCIYLKNKTHTHTHGTKPVDTSPGLYVHTVLAKFVHALRCLPLTNNTNLGYKSTFASWHTATSRAPRSNYACTPHRGTSSPSMVGKGGVARRAGGLRQTNATFGRPYSPISDRRRMLAWSSSHRGRPSCGFDIPALSDLRPVMLMVRNASRAPERGACQPQCIGRLVQAAATGTQVE